jgi:hypothetical protein
VTYKEIPRRKLKKDTEDWFFSSMVFNFMTSEANDMRPHLMIVPGMFIFILLVNPINAQDKKRDIYIDIEGLSSYGYPAELSGLSRSSIPTLGVGVGVAISKFYHAGLYVGYTYDYFIFEDPQSGYKDVWKGWDLGIKNTFHIGKLFLKTEKLDPYIGVITGYTQRSRVHISKTNIPDFYYDLLNYEEDAITIGGLGGVKYFISKGVALFGEMGITRMFFIGGGISIRLTCQD